MEAFTVPTRHEGEPIAAIVPAYNEEKTVGGVVRVLAASKKFRDIIVVSDGSTDNTGEYAKMNGATVVHQFTVQRGKGAALAHGVSHTDAPIIFFCDSDLYGLSSEHIDAILAPVLDGRLAMNVGIHDRGKIFANIAKHLPLIGGERAMRRVVFDSIPEKYLQGFMVEQALNYSCRSKGLPYGSVPLWGLRIRHKMDKVGFWRGLFQYVSMTGQVIYAMIIVRIAHLRGKF